MLPHQNSILSERASRSSFLPSALFVVSLLVGIGSVVSCFADSPFEGSVELQSQSSFSRLKVSLDESFKPVLEESKDGFVIRVPSATLMDIGVPFGADETFSKYLSKVVDSRIAKISVTEVEGALLIRGKYIFPTGPQSFANPRMEHFDFRQAEKGKFVIDFWYKKGPTVAEAEKQKRASELNLHRSEQEALLKKETERRLAREKRMQESKNAIQFCELPFDRSNTVFLKLRSSHSLLNFSAYFPEKIPDHRFEYTEPRGDSEEHQMVRLALKLSRENKHGLAVKTIDFLEKEYPKSKYLNEMRFLKASSHYRLELDDKGREMLQNLAKTARGTEVGLQAAAFLAVQSFKKQEWLAALDAFMNIKRENPHHPLIWLFRYGMAEAMYQIHQSDQAKVEYEWVSKNAPKTLVRAEAAFKIGDLSFDRSQYAAAIQSYSKAIKEFDSSLGQYPHALMNLAESYFQLEEYQKSEDAFKKFLAMGGAQPNAWRASLRIAEIHALNQKPGPETESAFTETVNRYPMTPGAVIARLRLLPCGNHGGFDLAGSRRFMSSTEVEKFDGGADLYTTSFRELVGLTEIRTLISFSQDQIAIDRGIARLRENPTVEVRKMMEQAMVGGIKRLIEGQLSAGEGYAAISTYEKYGDFLPLPSHDPMSDELRMKIAKFAAEKKLSTFALKLIEPYRQMNEADHKELLAAVEKNLALESSEEQDERNEIEAKTLWNSDQFKIDSEKQDEVFLARLGAIRDISTFAWERDLMKGLYFEEKKEDAKALGIATALVTKMGRLNSVQQSQIWFWAAELAQRNQNSSFAAKAFKEARLLRFKNEKASNSNPPELAFRGLKSVPSVTYLYTSEGEMLENQKKWAEAVALYSEAIENKVGGNQVLYAHARALLKEGDSASRSIASRSLEKIKQSQDDDVWKNLAQKALEEIAKEGKVDDKRKP